MMSLSARSRILKVKFNVSEAIMPGICDLGYLESIITVIRIETLIVLEIKIYIPSGCMCVNVKEILEVRNIHIDNGNLHCWSFTR